MLEEIVLNDLAGNPTAHIGLAQRLLINLDDKDARTSLLVLDGSRSVSLPMPGASGIRFWNDRDHDRFFVAADTSLVEFRLPGFTRSGSLPLKQRLTWNTRARLNLAISPDGSRALWLQRRRHDLRSRESRCGGVDYSRNRKSQAARLA